MSFWGRVLAAGAEDSFTDSYKPKKQAREACSAFGVRSCTRTQERCLTTGPARRLVLATSDKAERLRNAASCPAHAQRAGDRCLRPVKGVKPLQRRRQGNLANTRRSAGARGLRAAPRQTTQGDAQGHSKAQAVETCGL
jgi:hypothetical protein